MENNNKNNFKVNITRYKNSSEVKWLKDIHISLVNKYYYDISDPIYDNYDIGSKIQSSDGIIVGYIIDIITSNRDGHEYALIEIVKHINFNTLLQIGVPIENIIFDCHDWNYNIELNINEILLY